MPKHAREAERYINLAAEQREKATDSQRIADAGKAIGSTIVAMTHASYSRSEDKNYLKRVAKKEHAVASRLLDRLVRASD